MTEPIFTKEEMKELLKIADASVVEAKKRRREFLMLPLNERYEIILAESDAYALEAES